MRAIADNKFLLTDRDGRLRHFNERSSGLIHLVLVDEASQPLQLAQLATLKLWLYNRDDAARTIINSLTDHDLLSDAVRFSMGNAVSITGASNEAPIVITAAGHGYSAGDVVQIAGVKGNRSANGVWTVSVLDSDSFELIGASGSGAYTSGGVAVKAGHLFLQPDDNQIISAGPDEDEYHRMELLATYGSAGRLTITIEFPVRNLPKQ